MLPQCNKFWISCGLDTPRNCYCLSALLLQHPRLLPKPCRISALHKQHRHIRCMGHPPKANVISLSQFDFKRVGLTHKSGRIRFRRSSRKDHHTRQMQQLLYVLDVKNARLLSLINHEIAEINASMLTKPDIKA